MTNSDFYSFTDTQWQDLISEGLHIALIDEVGAKVAASSALLGYCHRYGLTMHGLHRLQLANEINTRMWEVDDDVA